MDERYSTKRLLVLRKLTRAVADLLRGQLREYLTTLAPLLRPKIILGEFVQGGSKESVKGAEAAFKELQTLYEALASSRTFNLARDLRPPLEVQSSVLELAPVEYSHAIKTDRDSKTVTVTSPLRWVATYSGFGLKRLRDLLAEKTRTTNELEQCVLHYLFMNLVVTKQTGVIKMLEGLHFSLAPGRLPGLGELPIIFVTADVPTIRPPDEVILESTEISGTDAFEEVVDLEQIVSIRDHLQQRLMEVAKSFGEELQPASLAQS